MTLTWIDWAIVVAYFALSAGIGLAFTKRGGESLNEYFLSGRNAPWWLAGASMVATTFAADTPLVVTGLVASNGVAGNWLWWNMLMSGMLTVFFFARLWRRANVMTDVEFAEVRYSGNRAAVLRGFRALYLALPINLIILGWVTRAMIKILTISLGLRDVQIAGMTVSGQVIAVGICFLVTMSYSVAAGMWAVLWTDLVQFVIKMSAVIILAVYSVKAVGGIAALKTGVAAHFGSEAAAISVLPVKFTGNGIEAYTWMPLLALGVFLAVQWWAAWYPGAEPGGGGYVAQRIFSARTERDGLFATLWFNIAHYAVRPWPWILTALASLVLYPDLVDKESGYVRMLMDPNVFPPALRGIMLAAFAAAYMSTLGTQLNWGASYVVNDFYRRFVRRDAQEREYVVVSQIVTVALMLVSIYVTLHLASIEQAWKLLIVTGAGTGTVLLLRWFWWRINAWSEVSAMAVAAAVSLYLQIVLKWDGDRPRDFAHLMLVTVTITTVAWLVVTWMTAPEPEATLVSFYRRVRPHGPGWAPVRRAAGVPPPPRSPGRGPGHGRAARARIARPRSGQRADRLRADLRVAVRRWRNSAAQHGTRRHATCGRRD